MADFRSKDVSDPLKHLFSLNFARSSPLLDDVVDSVNELVLESPNKGRRVRFSDGHSDDQASQSRTIDKHSELKGILKNKLSEEEKEAAVGVLNSDYSYEEYYSSDSVSSDDYSSDSSEKRADEEETIDRNVTENIGGDSVQVNEQSFDIFEGKKQFLEQKVESDDEEIVKKIVTGEVEDISFNDSIYRTDDENDTLQIKNVMKMVSSYQRKSYFETGKQKKHVFSSKHPSKPKLHICVISLDAKSGAMGTYSRTEVGKSFTRSQKLIYGRNIYAQLQSPQTLKLYLTLSKEDKEFPSAKQLKSTVFKAWQKIKSSENENKKNDLQPVSKREKAKSRKPEESTKAYIIWKQKKEMAEKKRKQKFLKERAKTNSSVPTLQKKKTKEEERNIVYNSWKQQKDEELKRLQEQLMKKKNEELNELKEKELQRKEAESSYIAWKAMKEKANEKKKELHIFEIEKLKQKALSKAERDREAEVAYMQWIIQKENIPVKDETTEFKPPWNPPG